MRRDVSRESQNYHYSLLGRPIKSVTGQFVRKAECQRSPQSSPESIRLRICTVKAEQHWAPNTGWDRSLLEDPQPDPAFQKPDFCQLGQGTHRLKRQPRMRKAFSNKLGHVQLLGHEYFLYCGTSVCGAYCLALRWFVEVSTLVLAPPPILLSKFKAGLLILASPESWP